MPISFLSLPLLAIVLLGITAAIFLLFARRNRSGHSTSGNTQQFSVSYTAQSSCAFPPECGIRLVQYAIPGGSADIELVTRYADGWGDIQNCLVVQADGNANTGAEFCNALHEPLNNI